MSGINAARSSPIEHTSFSGSVSQELPFDPKKERLPETLPECPCSKETKALSGKFITHGILSENMTVPGAARAIVTLDLIGRGTSTK